MLDHSILSDRCQCPPRCLRRYKEDLEEELRKVDQRLKELEAQAAQPA